MARINFSQVEQSVASIANRASYTADFIYELLAAYGRSKSSITRLRNGDANLATANNEILQKDVVYFKIYPKGTQLEPEVYITNDLIKKYHPRYIITTDLENLAAKDLKKGTTLTIPIRDIDRHVTFFYGWTGNEVVEKKEESVLDRKAADCMKDLYDEIEKINRLKLIDPNSNFRHDLNIFFSRLLFCFFAEDTGLFTKNLFSDTIKNYTETDGSDLKTFFERLFDALDNDDRSSLGQPFSDFPYVNGSVFDTKKHSIVVPDFNPESRYLLLRCSDFNWSSINPDIFGTIFQGIVDEKRRDENGMDYTSVANIEKVINPLFMDELEEEFEKSFENDSRVKDKNAKRIQNLYNLWGRIANIKLFDPACGSGNFLIISYKRLRELELRILDEITTLQGNNFYAKFSSQIKLKNFYGIELEDFPRELAVLSMYIAEHQMDMAFEDSYGKKIDMLPITDIPNIIRGNAARLDWNEVCPNNGKDEIYVIGNPPYKGSKKQSFEQKSDIDNYFKDENYSKNLDYVAIWFIKGSRYISNTKARLAFVTTNSVCQGEHVGIMFPKIYDSDVDIDFAYTSFRWQNNAKDNAGVTVIIIGLSAKNSRKKKLYTDGLVVETSNINAYLSDSSNNTIVEKRSKPLSGFPEMCFGNMPIDDGGFIITPEEANEIRYAGGDSLIKHFIGASEFIRGNDRLCLWITDDKYNDAISIRIVDNRIKCIAKSRAESKREETKKLASTPWKFGFISHRDSNSIIAPRVSSERRNYIPMGFLDNTTIISDAANAIYDAELWLFAILESKMHMAWIRTVCGKLKTDYRYSSTLGYNTFPCPPLTLEQKEKLSESAENILMARENHSEMTLSEMYDPNKMPADLRTAHDENDILVDKLYRNHAFASNEERLAVLFDLYEKMIKK